MASATLHDVLDRLDRIERLLAPCRLNGLPLGELSVPPPRSSTEAFDPRGWSTAFQSEAFRRRIDDPPWLVLAKTGGR